jgi:hypothetical protein
MVRALRAADLTHSTIRGLHFGGALGKGEPSGNEVAGEAIAAWLSDRFTLAPPR